MKCEIFPDVTDEDLGVGKDSFSRFYVEARKRLSVLRLSRALMLRPLIGISKGRKRRRPEV